MNYSKMIEASQESDLAYARWYAQQPKERKAEIFLNSYEFVTEKIRRDVLKKNPFASEAEIKLEFIRLTQKEDYSEAIFHFIEQKMEDEIDREWRDRFRKMKKNWVGLTMKWQIIWELEAGMF